MITTRHYELAIDALDAASQQTTPPTQQPEPCHVCGDAAHWAGVCPVNPLVALRALTRLRRMVETGDYDTERLTAIIREPGTP